MKKYMKEFENTKWRFVAEKMGITVRACQMRAKVLGLMGRR
jgi:hypothetical protein